MRHLKKGKKLSRETDQRKALVKSLVSALMAKGKITTTLTKAKVTAPRVEKLITKAKNGSLANRRLVLRTLSPSLTAKLFKEIAPKYAERKGGYTRVIKLGQRKSDSAQMAVLELV